MKISSFKETAKSEMCFMPGGIGMQDTLGMQMIMDSKGNYYHINNENRVVILRQNENNDEEVWESKTEYVDIERYDWKKYLKQFCYLAAVVGRRTEELNKCLSEVDLEICDLLHLAELYDLTEEEEIRAMKLMKDARQRRRDIKDEMVCLEYFQHHFGTVENVKEARLIIKQIERLDKRVYHPRKLPDLFEDVQGRETKRIFSKESVASSTVSGEQNRMNMEGADIMAQEKKHTIFDEQKNDWLTFARAQYTFFQNIPQYMINLQIELQELDEQIEAVMQDMENINFNASQGYKIVKELKDLRNARKEKKEELESLKILATELDCRELAARCVSAMEAMEEVHSL